MEGKSNRTIIVSISIFAMLTIGLFDYLTGYHLSFSIFYLIPILLMTWRVGMWPGVSMSVASAVIWGVADKVAGHEYSSIGILYWNSVVRLLFFLINAVMLSKIKSLYERERTNSLTDFLTGLANSRAFIAAVEDEMERARRYGHAFTLVYVDMDNFKSVNDRYGHLEGDRVLVQVARSIRENVRGVDVVGRMGGDEFAVIMSETGEVADLLERLRGNLLIDAGRYGWPIGFSIGAATFRTPPISVNDVISKADGLMYDVKTSGKNKLKHEIFD